MSRIFWDTNLLTYLFEKGGLTERIFALRLFDQVP